MHHFFFLLDHSSCYCPSSNSLFGYKACAFILVPGLLALQHMNICFDRGSFEHTSNFFKSSKNPSGKTLQNCFIHKSSTASYSYYSPPLVGTSHEEDTITTNFGRNKNAFCWLIGERTKLQRRGHNCNATELASLYSVFPGLLGQCNSATYPTR